MDLVLSIINAQGHDVIQQITYSNVPEEYREQVPLELINAAISCAMLVRHKHISPIMGQFTFTEIDILRNRIHCKIICDII